MLKIFLKIYLICDAHEANFCHVCEHEHLQDFLCCLVEKCSGKEDQVGDSCVRDSQKNRLMCVKRVITPCLAPLRTASQVLFRVYYWTSKRLENKPIFTTVMLPKWCEPPHKIDP